METATATVAPTIGLLPNFEIKFLQFICVYYYAVFISIYAGLRALHIYIIILIYSKSTLFNPYCVQNVYTVSLYTF